MSQICTTDQSGKKCGACGGHQAAMLMLGFVLLAVIGGLAAMFLG
jgi:hypothetical protein